MSDGRRNDSGERAELDAVSQAKKEAADLAAENAALKAMMASMQATYEAKMAGESPPKAAASAPEDNDEDEDAPRMNWPVEPAGEPERPPTESMARRMLKKVGFGKKKQKDETEGDKSRGFSLTRALGLAGGEGGQDGDRPRGPSLSRALGLVDKEGDLRGGSIGRLIFSEGEKDGKLKAFRGMRKLASRTRKAVTGLSSSEASESLAAARNFQKELDEHDQARERQLAKMQAEDDGSAPKLAPEERLMAAVGARRREWQMVYSHLYMKGLGMAPVVDRLLKCGITLADYHSLAVEDEDGDSQAMGFDDFDDMLDQDKMLADFMDEDDDEAKPKETASMAAAAAQHKKKSSLDEDLAIDTGCTIGEARKLRVGILAFYKHEKALGYLKVRG